MKGLYTKYVIQKSDGSPVDPEAQYFILRIDKGDYVMACRAALAVFARRVRLRNPTLADDIETKLLSKYDTPFPVDNRRPATLKSGWSLPRERRCPECGVKMRPTAVDCGDGFYLCWACENTCDEAEALSIDWPFVEDWASPLDLESIGFELD